MVNQDQNQKIFKIIEFFAYFHKWIAILSQFSGTKAYFISVVEEISLKTEKMNFLSFLATFMICLNFF